MQCINEDLKKMREDIKSLEKFESRARSRLAHDRCEHAATPYYAQRNQMSRSTMREMKEGGMPKREILSDFLHEYESQTKRFTDHITF